VETKQNTLERVGGQDLDARLSAINKLALTSARQVSRSQSAESRFEIPQELRPLYVGLDDDDLDTFAQTSYSLWRVVGIGQNHAKYPAKNTLPAETEFLRRFISLCRDLAPQNGLAPRVLMALSTEDIATIRKLTDDDIENMMKSGRINVIPRVAPEEKFRKSDSDSGWDGEALFRRLASDVEVLAGAR